MSRPLGFEGLGLSEVEARDPTNMPDIECIGDRFVPIERDCAIDLATGNHVTLVVASTGDASEQLAWTSRCDDDYETSAHGRSALLDYGRCGQAKRFEAWGAREAAAKGRVSIETAVAELFEIDRKRVQFLRLFGPPGSGKSAMLLRLARCARLQGFIPFAAHLLSSPLASVLEERSAFLIDDGGAAGLRVLVDVLLRSARPHVLLQTSTEDAPGLPNICLSRTSSRRTPVPVITRAAERAPVYGASATTIAWPVPGEVLALRQQVEEGACHIDHGRHAPGERALRQAIGGLMRRGEWSSAAEGSLALAGSLLKRGRPRDAKAAVEGARESCRKAQGDRLLIAAATLSGVALVDLGRLEEADTVLAAAQTVAAHSTDRSPLPAVSLALARCRFWRGQYADARDSLRLLLDRELTDVDRVRVGLMRARLSIAEDDIAAANGVVVETMECAERIARPGIVAEAASVAAFVHVAAGDLGAVRRDAAACATAARAARDPLRHLRTQLLLSELLRRGGARNEALRVFARCRRIPSAALPRVVRSRRDLLGDLLALDDPSHAPAILARQISSSGLHGLALFVPRAVRSRRIPDARSTPVDDAIEILHVCQTATDEATTLALVCEQVQRQTQAVAVGFFGIEAGALARLATRGPRLETSTAERAIEANVFVGPCQIDDRVEAAMPVRYGGAVVGALGLRWLIGTMPDTERFTSAASMAVAAAAPIVAAALQSRRRWEADAAGELLGISDTMVDVRKAVERAASAPFSVLIEGESGSGKELVARAVHKGGARRDRSFVTLNCAALPDDLVESELFGHARGAFTGAIGERIGVFEEAHTGTLFLDEVGELSPRAQAKVLRVIQEGELRRVGENVSRRIDVRVVSATNRDLRAEAEAGRFRLDLLYRLDVIRLSVPPLRDRREDIPVLIDHIWREAAQRYGSQATLAPAVVTALSQYDWPGNVRELQNVLASLVVRSGRRGVVPTSALPGVFLDRPAAESCRLDNARRAFDTNFVRAALVRSGGRRVQAASELGLTRQGLAKLMTRLGLNDDAPS